MGLEANYDMEESMYDEIVIPKITCGKNDDILLERVVKLKKGTFRIVLFMLVGMIMGGVSYLYVQDSFIVTKVILCVPYKISEVVYTSIIGTDALINDTFLSFNIFNEYFPQSVIATFLAERVTPVLIGIMLYGSMAYFTGDKRVFTLQRFLKFAGVQLGILCLFIASVYAVNAKAVSDNNQLKDVETFYLNSEDCAEIIRGAEAEILLGKFYKTLQKDESIIRNTDGEIRIGVIAANQTRWMDAYVNPKQGYIVTHGGCKYHISKEFTDCVKEYADTGELASLEAENEE